MSNNKNNRTNRGLLDTERNRANQDIGGYNETQRQRSDEFYNNAADTRQQVLNRYTNNNNFMPTGMAPNSQGFFDTSGMLKTASADFSKPKAGYEEASKTGLINRGDFSPALESYRGFMTGGGLSEGDVSNMRYRATSQIPEFYKSLKNTMARRANVQGGYSPGFDAGNEELAREASRGSYDAARKSEADIAGLIQQGREFGTAGYGNLMSDIAGKEQGGRLAGLSGLTGIAGQEADLSRFNASQGNALQQQLLDMYQRGGIESARGISDVNARDVGQYENAMGSRLAGIQGRAGMNLNNLGQRSSIQDRGFLDYLPGLLGGAGAIFGGLQGSNRNGGFFRRRGTPPASSAPP